MTMRNNEPGRRLDEDHDSRNEAEQDSDVPTNRESRVRRPLVRFAIDEIIKKNKNEKMFLA